MMLFTDIPLKGSSAIFMLTKLIKKGMFAVNVVYHQRDIFSLLDELKWMLLHLIFRLVSLGSHLEFSASLRLKFSLLCCQQFKNLHHHMADIFLHLKQKFLTKHVCFHLISYNWRSNEKMMELFGIYGEFSIYAHFVRP